MVWFDATAVDPSTGAQSFPLGRHLVVAKDSSRTPTKDNSGGMLVLTLEIIDGQYKGFTGPYRLNMWNASPQAAEIAGKQLSALCHVTGVYQLSAQPPQGKDCQEFFGKPFFILVEQQAPPNEKYTQIVGVLDASGNPPVKGHAPAAQQQQPAAGPAWQQPQQGPAPGYPSQQPAQPAWQPQGPGPATGYQLPPPPPLPQPQQPQQPAAPSWASAPPGGAPAWTR